MGEENRGVAVVMSGLDLERVGLSFLILGMAERALELTVEYARSRRQFGRPISDFQLTQFNLGRMYAMLAASSTQEKFSLNAEYVQACQRILKREWERVKVELAVQKS